jgi:hypothetical protein
VPVILALRRLRQEDHKFQFSLIYIARSCLKKKKKSEGMAKVVECLPIKLKAQAQTPVQKKNKKPYTEW